MVERQDIAFESRFDGAFDEAVARCREALAEEGFGVLTEIDIQATLLKKLGDEREPYVILGACHPPSAKRALDAFPAVGVMLPCNVTVSVEDGATVVRAMNPAAAMSMLDNPVVADVAKEISAALRRVVDKLA